MSKKGKKEKREVKERTSACERTKLHRTTEELTRLGEVLTVTLLDSFDRDTVVRNESEVSQPEDK